MSEQREDRVALHEASQDLLVDFSHSLMILEQLVDSLDFFKIDFAECAIGTMAIVRLQATVIWLTWFFMVDK